MPDTSTILAGAPATPVAVKVRGEPISPGDSALTMLVPAIVPSCRVTDACPFPSVLTVVVVIVAVVEKLPPPETMVKMTGTPGTVFTPRLSLTSTTSRFARKVPTTPV